MRKDKKDYSVKRPLIEYNGIMLTYSQFKDMKRAENESK